MASKQRLLSVECKSATILYEHCTTLFHQKLQSPGFSLVFQYDSNKYNLCDSFMDDHESSTLILTMDEKEICINFSDTQIQTDYITLQLLFNYNEVMCEVKIPLMTLLSGPKHHNYNLSVLNDPYSNLLLDFYIDTKDLLPCTFTLDITIQNTLPDNYYLVYTYQNQKIPSSVDKNKLSTKHFVTEFVKPVKLYDLLDMSLYIQLVYYSNEKRQVSGSFTVPFKNILFFLSNNQTKTISFHDNENKNFILNPQIHINSSSPLYCQLFQGQIDQYGSITYKKQEEPLYFINTKPFLSGIDMNIKNKDINSSEMTMKETYIDDIDLSSLLNSEDSKDFQVLFDDIDIKFQDIDSNELLLEDIQSNSQSSTAVHMCSQNNQSSSSSYLNTNKNETDENVKNNNEELDSDTNNNITMNYNDSVMSPYSNYYQCKILVDSSYLLPEYCVLHISNEKLEFFTLIQTQNISLLTLSSFLVSKLKYEDTLLTIYYNSGEYYHHKIELYFLDKTIEVNNLINSFICSSQAQFIYVKDISPYYTQILNIEDNEYYYINKTTKQLYKQIPTKQFYSITFISLIPSILTFSDSICSNSTISFYNKHSSLQVASIDINSIAYANSINIGDEIIEIKSENLSSSLYTDSLSYSYLYSYMNNIKNYPLQCTFKNPFI